MSEAISALNGATSDKGIATIREIGPQGMITLRSDLSGAKMKTMIMTVVGTDVPKQGRIETHAERAVAWMSPDELLILCPYASVAATLTHVQRDLNTSHHLSVDVSDARAMFQVSGPAAREVVAKLAPVDMSPGMFGIGMVRRTRLAQVPAAFWMRDDQTVEIVCFRSAAQYVFDLLQVAAQPGGEVGFF